MPEPTVRAVLLDLWDTLAWNEWHPFRDRVAERSGLSVERLRRALMQTLRLRNRGTYPDGAADWAAVFAAAGIDPVDQLGAEVAAMEADQLSRDAHLFDDSVPTLRRLRAAGLRTAVVSNCSHSTRPVVDRLLLAGEADAIVLSVEVGSVKPEPDIYRAALAELGAEAQQAVFVDDQVDYCRGAEEVGIRPYLIRRGRPTWDDQDPPDPAGFAVIASLQELPVGT